MKIDKIGFCIVFILVLVLYVWVANIAFAFRHPEMTDTQRFLHIVDALRFR